VCDNDGIMDRRFITILSITAVIIISAGGVCLADSHWDGTPASATPFDQKFNPERLGSYIPITHVPPPYESLFDLFQQARSIRYVPDKADDEWQAPETTEIFRNGDCEDQSLWLFKRLKQNHYDRTRIVVGKTGRNFEGYHAWIETIDSSGTRYILDPSTQRKVWKRHQLGRGYYIPHFSYDGEKRFIHEAGR